MKIKTEKWLLTAVATLAISTTAKAEMLAYDMFSGVMSGDVLLTGQNYSSPAVSGFSGAWSVSSTAMYRTATNFNASIAGVGLGAGTQQGGIWYHPGENGNSWNKSFYATRQLAPSAYVNLNSNNTYYYSFYALSPDDNAVTVGFSTGSTTADKYIGVGLTWNNATEKGTNSPNLGNDFVINNGTLDGSVYNGVYGINAAGMKSGLNDTAAVDATIFYVAVIYASATGNDIIKMTGYNAANPVNGQVWTAEYSFASDDTFTHLLIGMTGGANESMNVDGFRLGTSFADVVPEPASMTLLVTGVFLMMRRRKT